MAARAYFDWNATAPLRAEALAAMTTALASTGNPSSVHAEGRAARHMVEAAREQVAALVGAQPKNVTFTGGGTEANMLALTPAIEVEGRGIEPRDRLFVSAIEHSSVGSSGRFAPAAREEIAVTADGVIDLAALERQIAGAERPLVSVMLANNETGAVQPIREVAQVVHEAGGLLHVDAIQAAGKMPIDISDLKVDLLVVSAHKLGGPQGVGALIRRDAAVQVAPLVTGGGQERGLRAGTENVAAIAGFGAAAAAAKAALQASGEHMAATRRRLELGLRAWAPEVVIFSEGVTRLPNTTLVTVPGLKAETAVIAFDLEGIAVSSGSACSSGKVTPSHVLAAMGCSPELARGAIRISLGWTTTEEEVENLLSAWNKIVSTLSKGQPGIAA